MSELTLEITEEDIAKGARGSISDCAVALVAKRIFGHDDITAGIWTVKNHRTGKVYRYSDDLRVWTARFDKDRDLVQPGTYTAFELDNDPEIV